MEKELNIAAILKEKPNTKVWSDTFGELTFEYIDNQSKFPISLTAKNGNSIDLTKDGRYYCDVDGVLPCIVPSKQMRDWSKFTWKKGDVLTTNGDGRDKIFCFFTGWANDNYTSFSCEWQTEDSFLKWERYNQYGTEHFHLANGLEIDEYFSRLLARYGGQVKFSKPKTKQSKFNDGDIMAVEGDNLDEKIFIFHDSTINHNSNEVVCKCYASLNSNGSLLYETHFYIREDVTYSLATDSEKQQLFDALAKENKAWDEDKKMLVDLPKKCEFKAFDKVLVHYYGNVWQIGLFIKMTESKESLKPYIVLDMLNCKTNNFAYCIPYNDSTKHLLGTTDEWKGGER